MKNSNVKYSKEGHRSSEFVVHGYLYWSYDSDRFVTPELKLYSFIHCQYQDLLD